jgi:ParB family chromosome partitioning protein
MALGKGLEALIPQRGDEILYLDITRIFPGEQQPRRMFRDESLQELAGSIKEKGVLQPVIVSRAGDGTFRLIAGERRWRAAKIAELKNIPALVKDVASKDSLEIALIENIHREDLNPVETAEAFNRLITDFRITQEELSGRVGKDRATIANYLRILKLPDEIRAGIYNGSLSMGHAKALLSIENRALQIEAARRIVKNGLSVREAEALSRSISKPKPVKKAADPQIASLEDNLIKKLGTRVKIKHRGKRGRIEIQYFSLDELDRLLEILMA